MPNQDEELEQILDLFVDYYEAGLKPYHAIRADFISSIKQWAIGKVGNNKVMLSILNLEGENEGRIWQNGYNQAKQEIRERMR